MEIDINGKQIEYILNCVESSAFNGERLNSFYDSVDGRVVDFSSLIEDFGDIVPFLFLCNKKYLAESEFSFLKKSLDNDILHINLKKGKRWIVHTYDWTDLILGLVDYYILSNDVDAKTLATKLIDRWERVFVHEQCVTGQALKLGDKLYSLPLSRGLDVGMFPELLVKYSQLIENNKKEIYINLSRKIIDFFTSSDFFITTGLFPDSYKIKPNFFEKTIFFYKIKSDLFNQATLFKNNTNTLASVISIWNETRDGYYLEIIDKWIDGVKNHMTDNDGFIGLKWSKKENKIIHGPGDLNFQVIDLMCDMHNLSGAMKYLNFAKKLADLWLSKQSEIGFIPHYLYGDKSNYAMSDTQTDFSVALFKLYALTGEKKYFDCSCLILNAIEKFMYLPHGMANWVDANSGVVIDSTCKTKFLILSLKGWLAKNNVNLIYKDMVFTELLSDR